MESEKSRMSQFQLEKVPKKSMGVSDFPSLESRKANEPFLWLEISVSPSIFKSPVSTNVSQKLNSGC